MGHSVKELRGWCELRTNDKLFVWQGVLSFRNSCGTVWLMKTTKKQQRRSDDNYIKVIRLSDIWNLKGVQITSDGYWTCAEITCCLKSKNIFDEKPMELYYHCSNPKEGYDLLKFAKHFADELTHDRLVWCSVSLKADMNPFRNLNFAQIEMKKRKWSLMLKHCTRSPYTVTDDVDMLSYDYRA